MERIQIRHKEFQKVSLQGYAQDTLQVIFHLYVCVLNAFQMSSKVTANPLHPDQHHIL